MGKLSRTLSISTGLARLAMGSGDGSVPGFVGSGMTTMLGPAYGRLRLLSARVKRVTSASEPQSRIDTSLPPT